MQNDFSAAIDIGGTFTDTVIKHSKTQQTFSTKNPTTTSNPTIGAITGFKAVLEQSNLKASQISRFIHGTTLATNALIEKKGAKTAIITTHGFRDILEIAYERRYSQYDIMLQKPDLLVPRSLSYTVIERLNVKGEVLTPLDNHSVNVVIEKIALSGAQSIAICLVHSYADPVHEIQLRDEIAKHLPYLHISLSSEVSPEAREFERMCTTVANAYLKPFMIDYLTQFESEFAKIGLTCPILMMTSSAGMTTLETAKKLPIRLVESGPSGGAVMAAQSAKSLDIDQVLSFDMGGTTAKLCLIDHHTPKTARNFEINRAARFIKGSGMPVRIPVVEMIEIGAGGGSYAGLDRLGRITIGPESAGAEPGPAAFDRGGTVATVTDSDVVQGYIDPTLFAQQQLPLNQGLAKISIDTTIGESLGLNTIEAAYCISQIVNENMANAGRMHGVESGVDISSRTMIAFGGNGPLHATRLARRCGIEKIVIPRSPGVGSAIGFLDAPVSYEIIRSQYTLLDTIDISKINILLADISTQATNIVRLAAKEEELDYQYSAYMRYHGQGHEIEVNIPNMPMSLSIVKQLNDEFEFAYSKQYSRIVPDMEIEVLNWAVKVSTVQTRNKTERWQNLKSHNKPISNIKPIICDVSGQTIHAQIHLREDLQSGDEIKGPALIIESQTTTLVSRDFNACIDSLGNIILTKRGTAHE